MSEANTPLPIPADRTLKVKKKSKGKSFRISTLSGLVGILVISLVVLIRQHVYVIRVFQTEEQQAHRTENGGVPLPPTLTMNYRSVNATTNNTTPQNMRQVTGYFDDRIREFEHHEGVVIATKIHSDAFLPMLEQMLCLLHQAYNHRVLYDIVVFTTEPILESNVTIALQQVVAPAKLSFVQDNRGLQQEIAALLPARRAQFAQDCRLKDEASLVNLTWYSKCPGRIAYNHQAEFRSWHIWKHPSLQDYHWMMWLDADAFCAFKWRQDPIAIAMQHNLTILFDNFPQGTAGGKEIQNRIRKAMNGGSLCNVKMTPQGHFQRQVDNDCKEKVEGGGADIPLVHGFFHITNMDFYRRHIYWAEVLIGNGFLQRKFDDQVAVTVPAAYYTPKQSFLLRKVGIELGVYHNGRLDGNRKMKGGGFRKYWTKHGGKDEFPEGNQRCSVVTGG